MKKNNLNKSYWENRYFQNQIGWDLGVVSPAIKFWFDNEKNKSLNILIPGAGNGYEAKYGFENGFKNIFYLDLSDNAVKGFKKNCPYFPNEQILMIDFFDVSQIGFFDVIIEQTFFCAMNPKLRKKYVDKAYQILNSNGKIFGLLFEKIFNTEGPPFGGSHKDYYELFSSKFDIKTLEKTKKSVSARKGFELWMEAKKKEW